MPQKWIDPELFFRYKGVSIFHTYKNDNANGVKFYWYTTDPIEPEDSNGYSFDVRELPLPAGCLASDAIYHQAIIKNAIDNGLLTLPEYVEYKPEENEADYQHLKISREINQLLRNVWT